ncbi:hypothetical protein PGT21_025409 [Puccinia graminis f. sp. tritici]|uniref:Uncharacterized protein n=2 Tax=Puccinia graminis f. sp. tritici TaxID=56615 RepID=A0A5B0S5Y7_PUCGR|nr:hypothetical protein PGT21_025409 [Puccinia graminis f. sp. tritici]KAA1132583.1 hypothetical protein PGTUg99_010541 [Puccinia graminis f. sp. tritici]
MYLGLLSSSEDKREANWPLPTETNSMWDTWPKTAGPKVTSPSEFAMSIAIRWTTLSTRFSLLSLCFLGLALKIICFPADGLSTLPEDEFIVYQRARSESANLLNARDPRARPTSRNLTRKQQITNELLFINRPTPIENGEQLLNYWKNPLFLQQSRVERIETVKNYSPRELDSVRRELEQRLRSASYQLLIAFDSNVGIKPKYDKKLKKIQTQISKALSAIFHPKPPSRLNRVISLGSGEKSLQENNALLVLDILHGFEKSSSFLQDKEAFASNKVNVKALSLIYLMNDLFVELLAGLDKEGLIGDELTREILNNQNGGRWIFNWLIGRHPPTRHIPDTYFIFDLKSSMEESPSIRLIHGLLEYLDPATWRNIERLYLDCQIATFASLPDISNLGKEFRILTAPGAFRDLDEHTIQMLYQEFLKKVIHGIFPQSTQPLTSIDMQANLLVRAKTLNDMLRFIVQHHVEPSSLSQHYMAQIRQMAEFPKIEALEKVVMLYSESLRLTYLKLARKLLQLPDRKSDAFKTHGWAVIQKNFLADIWQRERFSIFQIGTSSEVPDARGKSVMLANIPMSNDLNLNINSLGLGTHLPEVIDILVQKIQTIHQELQKTPGHTNSELQRLASLLEI